MKIKEYLFFLREAFTIKLTRDLDTFIKLYDEDVTLIILRVFSKIIDTYPLEEVKQHLYLKLLEKEVLLKFDEDYGVKFSTYIYTVIRNFIYSYYNWDSSKYKNLNKTLSLDELAEKGYSPENTSEDTLEGYLDLRLDLNAFKDYLSQKESVSTNIQLSYLKLFEYRKSGLNDLEISLKVNCSSVTVGNMRKKLKKEYVHFLTQLNVTKPVIKPVIKPVTKPKASCPHCFSDKTNYSGKYRRKRSRQLIQRYTCSNCDQTFSDQTFSKTYKQKKPDLNQKILEGLRSGMSLRKLASALGTTKTTIQRKAKLLAV